MGATLTHDTPPDLDTFLPARPVGKSSPRVMRWGGVRYRPTTEAWLDLAVARLALAWRKAPIAVPVRVELLVGMPVPKRPGPDQVPPGLCTTKPDVDNVAKAALDALVRAGVLRDDVLVTDLVVRKRWASRGQEGVRVKVWAAW